VKRGVFCLGFGECLRSITLTRAPLWGIGGGIRAVGAAKYADHDHLVRQLARYGSRSALLHKRPDGVQIHARYRQQFQSGAGGRALQRFRRQRPGNKNQAQIVDENVVTFAAQDVCENDLAIRLAFVVGVEVVRLAGELRGELDVIVANLFRSKSNSIRSDFRIL
jgi:hypothetical protein